MPIFILHCCSVITRISGDIFEKKRKRSSLFFWRGHEIVLVLFLSQQRKKMVNTGLDDTEAVTKTRR